MIFLCFAAIFILPALSSSLATLKIIAKTNGDVRAIVNDTAKIRGSFFEDKMNTVGGISWEQSQISAKELPLSVTEVLQNPGRVRTSNSSSDTIFKLSQNSFFVSFSEDVPQVAYLGVLKNSVFDCERIWPGDPRKSLFRCDDEAGLSFDVNPVAIDEDLHTMEVLVTLPDDVPTVPESVIMTALDHMKKVTHETATIQSVSRHNTQRSKTGDVYASVCFWCMAMIIFLHINLTTVLMNYLFGKWKACHWSLIWISIAAITSLAIFIPKSGAVGLGIVFLSMILFDVVSGLVYCCTTRKKKSDGGLETVHYSRSPTEGINAGKKHDLYGTTPEIESTETVDMFGSNETVGRSDQYCCKEYGRANFYPRAFSRFQKMCALGNAVGVVIFWIMMVIILLTWNVDGYLVIERETQEPVVEYIPDTIEKPIMLMYSLQGVASQLNLPYFYEQMSDYCGPHYKTELTTDSEKYESIHRSFIVTYDIDMTQFDPSVYTEYSSVNDWFTRKLAPGVRPISQALDPSIAVSPADARVIVFENVDRDRQVWIKGSTFNTEDIIGSVGYNKNFENGPMALIRLAVQDYHRFHSPVSGTLVSNETIEGPLHSVNADAMTSGNKAIENWRISSIIDTEEFGSVAYVMIGATCVGSVVMTAGVDDFLNKGDEVGYFEYGGSTIAIFFERNTIQFDPDLIRRSQSGVETVLKMGQRLGVSLIML